ncbi:MAG: naphthalene 1,2-dioxygenase [Robiginitomaculum sp.]|nr:MAG: naphthalene 1,2-dioxygenase [Robiginitomaculum sp.]
MTDLTWFDALASDALPEGEVVGVMAEGLDIALYNVEGDVFATANICTHGNARLCDGFLEGHEVECPLHQGMFDVRDGRPTCVPALLPLQTYNVKIESGRVWIALEETDKSET